MRASSLPALGRQSGSAPSRFQDGGGPRLHQRLEFVLRNRRQELRLPHLSTGNADGGRDVSLACASGQRFAKRRTLFLSSHVGISRRTTEFVAAHPSRGLKRRAPVTAG